VTHVPTRLLGKSGSLILVTKNIVSIWEHRVQRIPEKLNDENGSKIDSQKL
jgi:hypothetical protein